jgi:hypothetical protein
MTSLQTLLAIPVSFLFLLPLQVVKTVLQNPDQLPALKLTPACSQIHLAFLDHDPAIGGDHEYSPEYLLGSYAKYLSGLPSTRYV